MIKTYHDQVEKRRKRRTANRSAATKKLLEKPRRVRWPKKDLEARALIKLKNSYDLALEYHKDTNTFAQSSIRMALIFNGSAILVIMNFLGSLIRSPTTPSPENIFPLMIAIISYTIGAVLGIAASSFSYFGNGAATRARAFEATEDLLLVNPDGYRELQGPKRRHAKREFSNTSQYIESNHKAATTYRILVVFTMLTSYIIFGIATIIASTSIMKMLGVSI